MHIIYQFASFQILLIGVFSLDVRLPPTITKHPSEYKVYRSDDDATLECEATGTPAPQYEWLKNGSPLLIPGVSSNLYQIKEGTLQIRPLTTLDEGFYQCKAFNQYGTALSKMSYLRRAVLEPLTRTDTFESEVVEEGKPYFFQCQPTKVFPKPLFSWALAKKDVDPGRAGQQESQGIPVSLGKRIQIDENGNLHFAFVTPADAPDDKVYKCNMYNPHLDVTIGGSYSRLRVAPKEKRNEFDPPSVQFHSPRTVIALEGQNVTLRCFFSGYPEPTVSWTKIGPGASLPAGRYVIGNYYTDLTIRKVEPSDEGEYRCTATNHGVNFFNIEINVQAAPVFRSINDQPHNRNITEGNSVMIRCIAHAEPPAEVAWFINGKPIDFENLPKYQLHGNGSYLTITNLCKDCKDSDLTVIQCNASNVHGYAFADGYINVLKKTSIIIKPEDVRVSEGKLSAQFDCMAQSDDSTPVTIDWYRVSTTDDMENDRIYNSSGRIFISADSSLYFHVENYTDWIRFRGRYRCQAKNGYSIASASAILDADDLPPLPPPPVQTAGIGDLWWIFVIIAVILLLLIFLICCCICLQQNKGDTYPVDKKERKSGNNPEKELADGGFHDYQRPEGEPLKGSRASLSSSIKIDSDEEASLNEYGDIDAGKFTEDGSFISDYGVSKKRANAGDHKV